MKILFIIAACIATFLFFCNHDYLYSKIPKEALTPEVHKLLNFISIPLYLLILFLFSTIYSDLFPSHPYSSLSSDELSGVIDSIDTILYEYYDEDDQATLFCYFEDPSENISFSKAAGAYSRIRSDYDNSREELFDIYSTLKSNYVEK